MSFWLVTGSNEQKHPIHNTCQQVTKKEVGKETETTQIMDKIKLKIGTDYTIKFSEFNVQQFNFGQPIFHIIFINI